MGYSPPTKAMPVHLGPHQTDLGQFQVQVQSRFETGAAFHFKPFYMGSMVEGGRSGRNMTELSIIWQSSQMLLQAGVAW